MAQIPSFSELVSQRVAEQMASRQAAAAAARESALRRIAHEAEYERQKPERAAQAAAQLVLRREITTTLQDDCKTAADLLNTKGMKPDLWKGSIDRKLVSFKLWGKSRYQEVDNRRGLSWLLEIPLRTSTDVIRTEHFTGMQMGDNYLEGGQIDIVKYRYLVSPIALGIEGDLITSSTPVEVGSAIACGTRVPPSPHITKTDVIDKIRSSSDNMYTGDRGIELVPYNPVNRWSDAELTVKFQAFRTSLVDYCMKAANHRIITVFSNNV